MDETGWWMIGNVPESDPTISFIATVMSGENFVSLWSEALASEALASEQAVMPHDNAGPAISTIS